MTGRWLLGIFILAATALIFFYPFSALPFQQIISGNKIGAEADQLAVENAALKARIAFLEGAADAFPAPPLNAIAASVYVRYPFNFKGEIMIDRGVGDGIAPGMPVVLGALDSGQLAFVGRILEVTDKWATVQTLQDTRFQMGVRIGVNGIEALATGGNQPKLAFIEKNAEVHPGDAVYAATPGVAYGLSLGEVKEVLLASGGLLQEAPLRLPYNFSQIKKVFVIK